MDGTETNKGEKAQNSKIKTSVFLYPQPIIEIMVCQR